MNNVWIKNKGTWKLLKVADIDLPQYRGIDGVVINPPTEGLAGIPPHHWKKLGGKLVPMTPHERSIADRIVAEHAEKERISMGSISADKKKLAILADDQAVEARAKSIEEATLKAVADAHAQGEKLSKHRLIAETLLAEKESAERISRERQTHFDLVKQSISDHQVIMDSILKEREDIQKLVSDRLVAEKQLMLDMSSEKAHVKSLWDYNDAQCKNMQEDFLVRQKNSEKQIQESYLAHVAKINAVIAEKIKIESKVRLKERLKMWLVTLVIVCGLAALLAFK